MLCSGWELVLGSGLQRASGRPEALSSLLRATSQEPAMVWVGPTEKIVICIEFSVCTVGIKKQKPIRLLKSSVKQL